MNKKYQILKRLGANWTPHFANEFNDLNDARLFRNLLQKAEDETASPNNKWNYYIVEVIE